MTTDNVIEKVVATEFKKGCCYMLEFSFKDDIYLDIKSEVIRNVLNALKGRGVDAVATISDYCTIKVVDAPVRDKNLKVSGEC